MSITRPCTTHMLRRSVFGALSILAIAPVLYFAACSSGGDNGGGGGTPPPSGGSSANQFAYVIASASSEIQANNLDASGNVTPIGGRISTGVNPHHVDVDRAGRFVYVSNHDSSFVSGWQ